jgi:hypothetical protein
VFSNDAAIALDCGADHGSVAVFPCATFRQSGYEKGDLGPVNDRDLQYTSTSQQPDMARSKPCSGRNESRSGCRNRARLFDIVTGDNCLDDLDVPLAIGLGQLQWDDSVGPGWQPIARGNRH